MLTYTNNKYHVFQPPKDVFYYFPDSNARDIAQKKLEEAVDWLNTGYFKTARLDQKTADIYTIWLTRETRLFLSRKGANFYILAVMYDHDKYGQYLPGLIKKVRSENQSENPYQNYIPFQHTLAKENAENIAETDYALNDISFFGGKFIEIAPLQFNIIQEELKDALIFGPPGTGKSSTGIAKVREFYRTLKQGRIVVVVPTQELCDIWQQSWKESRKIFDDAINPSVTVSFVTIDTMVQEASAENTLADDITFKHWLRTNYAHSKKEKNTAISHLNETHTNNKSQKKLSVNDKLVYSELKRLAVISQEHAKTLSKKDSLFKNETQEKYIILQNSLYELLFEYQHYLTSQELFDPALSTYSPAVFDEDLIFINDEIQLSHPKFIEYLQSLGHVIGLGDYLQSNEIRITKVLKSLFESKNYPVNYLDDTYRMSKKVLHSANIFLRIWGKITDQSPVEIKTCSSIEGDSLFYRCKDLDAIASTLSDYNPSDILFVYEEGQVEAVPSKFNAYIHSSLNNIGGREFKVIVAWDPHQDKKKLLEELNNILKNNTEIGENAKKSCSYQLGLERNTGEENIELIKIICVFFLIYSRALHKIICVSDILLTKEYIARELNISEQQERRAPISSTGNNTDTRNDTEGMCFRIYEILTSNQPDIKQARRLINLYAPASLNEASKIAWFTQWAQQNLAEDTRLSTAINCLAEMNITTETNKKNTEVKQANPYDAKAVKFVQNLGKTKIRTTDPKLQHDLKNKAYIVNIISLTCNETKYDNDAKSKKLFALFELLTNFYQNKDYIPSLNIFLAIKIIKYDFNAFLLNHFFLTLLIEKPKKLEMILSDKTIINHFINSEKYFTDFCDKFLNTLNEIAEKHSPIELEKILHIFWKLKFPSSFINKIYGAYLFLRESYLAKLNSNANGLKNYFTTLFADGSYGVFCSFLSNDENTPKSNLEKKLEHSAQEYMATKLRFILLSDDNNNNEVQLKFFLINVCATNIIYSNGTRSKLSGDSSRILKLLDPGTLNSLVEASQDEDTLTDKFLKILTVAENDFNQNISSTRASSIDMIMANFYTVAISAFLFILQLFIKIVILIMYQMDPRLCKKFPLVLTLKSVFKDYIFISVFPSLLRLNTMNRPWLYFISNKLFDLKSIHGYHPNNQKIFAIEPLLLIRACLSVVSNLKALWRFQEEYHTIESVYKFYESALVIGIAIIFPFYLSKFILPKEKYCRSNLDFSQTIDNMSFFVINNCGHGFFSKKAFDAFNPKSKIHPRYPHCGE